MAQKKDRDTELRQVMAEERGRGSRRPVKAETLQKQRRLRKAAEMLANKECDKRDYLSGLRELGLQDGSPEFLEFVKAWDAYRGRS
jgi:hypothetical protein